MQLSPPGRMSFFISTLDFNLVLYLSVHYLEKQCNSIISNKFVNILLKVNLGSNFIWFMANKCLVSKSKNCPDNGYGYQGLANFDLIQIIKLAKSGFKLKPPDLLHKFSTKAHKQDKQFKYSTQVDPDGINK